MVYARKDVHIIALTKADASEAANFHPGTTLCNTDCLTASDRPKCGEMDAPDYMGGHDCSGCAGCQTLTDKGIKAVSATEKTLDETECNERCALKIDCSAFAFSMSTSQCEMTNSTKPEFFDTKGKIAGKRCPGSN